MRASDLCIVGAGPAGSMLAARLARAGLSVTVVEAGPRHPLAERTRMMRAYLRGDDPWALPDAAWGAYTNAGEATYPLADTRAQGVGGGTLHWEGYTPRLAVEDFRLRSLYGIAEDWPISYWDLEPYYVQAERELGVAGSADDPGMEPRSAPYPLPEFPFSYSDRFFAESCAKLGITFAHLPQARNSEPYGGRAACATCGTCFVCPTGAKATADLTHIEAEEATGRATVLSETIVGRIEAVGRRATRARGRTRAGKPVDLEADVFVLAAGAVENARLLLLSRTADRPTGLANSSRLVGRCFMTHPVVDVSGTVPHEVFPYRTGFSTATSHQFVAPATRAEDGSLLLEFMNNAGPTPRSVAEGSSHWGKALEAEIRARFGRTAQIRFQVEQLPDAGNRVDLDPQVEDPAGDPTPRLRLSLSPYEKRAMERAEEIGRRILARMGAKQIARKDLFSAHQLGTARMGVEGSASAVDPDLRAHDLDNLYVLGGSAFVTSGSANPTLTIGALALRLADHLIQRMGARSGGRDA